MAEEMFPLAIRKLRILCRIPCALQKMGEDAAAYRFKAGGPRGTWTIKDTGVGHAAHNNGLDANLPHLFLQCAGQLASRNLLLWMSSLAAT